MAVRHRRLFTRAEVIDTIFTAGSDDKDDGEEILEGDLESDLEDESHLLDDTPSLDLDQEAAVYMKDKPTKWGFKLYELCESQTGYVYSLEMYCADKRISNKPVDVSMRLMEPLLNQGYRLYLDNYYCCPELWSRLQGRQSPIDGGDLPEKPCRDVSRTLQW
ncbi:PiggyBac transposable element-derived protein 4-like [Elysia marginata]|uniref:PiggyBac transposable element-derived protein 4-like n=1 Tax=Elysia marginata TaxID=1093978 RepID=A0AAV4GRR0_9GAST|nr:PiggyBac transposable element-derived protein 4-like [Elysia marginata]